MIHDCLVIETTTLEAPMSKTRSKESEIHETRQVFDNEVGLMGGGCDDWRVYTHTEKVSLCFIVSIYNFCS